MRATHLHFRRGWHPLPAWRQLERERLENLAAEREETLRVARAKKEASVARMRLMHQKVRTDYANSAAVLRHRKLAKLSGQGIEVRL